MTAPKPAAKPVGLTHGRVDLCNCFGLSRTPVWKGEGHAPDCPARQPDFDADAHTIGDGERPVHGKER